MSGHERNALKEVLTKPVVKWWGQSRRFARLGVKAQKRAAPQPDVRAARLRVAALPPEIGKPLDKLHAPFRVLRWIAWAPGTAGLTTADHRFRRYTAISDFFGRIRRWPSDAEIRALDQAGAETDPATPDHGTDAASQEPGTKEALIRQLQARGVAVVDGRSLIDALFAVGIMTPGAAPSPAPQP